jgi:hypothetical protein
MTPKKLNQKLSILLGNDIVGKKAELLVYLMKQVEILPSALSLEIRFEWFIKTLQKTLSADFDVTVVETCIYKIVENLQNQYQSYFNINATYQIDLGYEADTEIGFLGDQ